MRLGGRPRQGMENLPRVQEFFKPRTFFGRLVDGLERLQFFPGVPAEFLQSVAQRQVLGAPFGADVGAIGGQKGEREFTRAVFHQMEMDAADFPGSTGNGIEPVFHRAGKMRELVMEKAMQFLPILE